MQNTKKICGQSQSFLNFYFCLKVYFIYFSILMIEKEERNSMKNKEGK
jgi:hypothetical protein